MSSSFEVIPSSIDCKMEKRSYCIDGGADSSSSCKSSGSKEDETIVTASTGLSSSQSVSSFNDYKFNGPDGSDKYFNPSRLDPNHPVSFVDVEKGPDEDKRSTKSEVILFGFDLSNVSAAVQFMICAFGVFFFNILYGYLQELIQIQIAGRQFAIFLGACQFAGYAFWSAILSILSKRSLRRIEERKKFHNNMEYRLLETSDKDPQQVSVNITSQHSNRASSALLLKFFAMAIIRAADLGLTNLSMRYLNYPAKTLIKSSRVIFTMMMGIIVGRKKYTNVDYTMAFMLVCGLSLFLHADMTSNAVFHPLGVCMLVTSLSLDGGISNWSEMLMNRHNMGQDEFQMKLYFFSFIIMSFASFQMNELESGMNFFFHTHGTMNEIQDSTKQSYSWSIHDKIIVLFLFSTLGIFGGSCAAAITKRFGALAMSVTTTTRKAATIFLSFALFPNACTPEHIVGVLIFVMGLLLKGGLCNFQSTSELWSTIKKIRKITKIC